MGFTTLAVSLPSGDDKHCGGDWNPDDPIICSYGPSDRNVRKWRAFTLMEVVVSIAVTSVIMLAMGSVLLVSLKALPDPERTVYKVNQAGQIAHDVMEELHQAIHVTDSNSTAITFTVADRDGDGSPERIRYAWSGTAGDPLTRQYNFDSAVTVLADVNHFNLGYDLKTLVETYPGYPVEGVEILLSEYNGDEDLKDFKIKHDDWIGQYFEPNGVLPPDAVSWRVTRVKFEAKEEGSSDEDSYVQLRPADAAKKPTATVIEQQVMDEEDLGEDFEWHTFLFTGEHNLEPGSDLCLVVQGTGDGSAKIRYEDKDDDGATGRLKTSDTGSSWEYKDDKCLRHEIYGKAAAPGPDQTASRQYVTAVQVALQSGTEASTRIDTSVHLPNAPELLSAVWELDFDTDPTALNMNGDALSDWNIRGGGSIDSDDLVDGVWYVSGGTSLDLDTVPDNGFTELTTIDLRFRCTEIDANGVYFQINADNTGGNFMPIVVTLDLMADTTQTASVSVGGTDVVTVPSMSADFVDVRLLIDPALNTVNIQIADTDRGTFAYVPYAPSGDPKRATLHEWGSDAEWDYVRIRVGGNN